MVRWFYRYVLVTTLSALLAGLGNSQLVAAEPAGTELTFALKMSSADFQSFVLPDSEDAVGILLAGPSDGSADVIGIASSMGSWGGVYSRFKTIKYISKGGVASARLYWAANSGWGGDHPACLKIGADRALDVAYYYVSVDGNGNYTPDPDGGEVMVFVHGTF